MELLEKNATINDLKRKIEPLRAQLVEHPLYYNIKQIADLQVFMQGHIFAVWDFMSLLKSLQNKLTCTDTPWLPVGSANTRYLINEIVLGEESDIDEKGNRISHFELYLEAMKEAKADTTSINALLDLVKKGVQIEDAIAQTVENEGIRQFLNFTFDTVKNSPIHVQAAVFTFGREDLIPDMFITIVKELNQQYPNSIKTFKYYLERHIEVDGEHHSHLAMEMLTELCGDDAEKWSEVGIAVEKALEMRIGLWNAILEEL